MNRTLKIGTVAATLIASSTVSAGDARSIALGGAVIANGKGVHGVLSNPASMMSMQRRGETSHVRFGFAAESRLDGDSVDVLQDSDNKDLFDDIEQEIETLNGQPIECNPVVDGDDAVCVSGTQRLSDISTQVLNILDTVNGETFEGYGTADLGMAYTRSKFPFAINFRVSAAGRGTPEILEGDRSYITEFADTLNEDTVTLGEIQNTSFLTVEKDENDIFASEITVTQPEDVLESEATGGALVRSQLSVSLATTVAVGGIAADVGVTPKLSSLIARSVTVNVGEEARNQDDLRSIEDRFEDSEVQESSFTADVGASVQLPNAPLRVAAVIRNLIPESIKTRDDFEFETTPQLVLGAAFHRNKLSLTGDLALNAAKQDGFETQKMGIGVEFGTRLLALRGGIAHDSSRSDDSTALTLGFTLGPLELGGRVSSSESIEAGAQLSYSFY